MDIVERKLTLITIRTYGNKGLQMLICLSPPHAFLALQYGRFVKRELLAAKGLFQEDPSGFKKGLEQKHSQGCRYVSQLTYICNCQSRLRKQ